MRRKKINFNPLPYYLILPSAIILVCTILYPIFLTLIYSFEKYSLIKPYNKKFVGLQNYTTLLADKNFFIAMQNTGIIVGIILIMGVSISFVISLILNKKTKLTNLLTAIAIIPWALPPVVNGVIWKFIFYPEFGLINKIFYFFDWTDSPLLWLNSKNGTLIILGIIVSWRAIPFCAILLLSSIKAIPLEIFEATKIDGANFFSQVKNIIIPILSPTFIIVITNLILTGINVFDEVVALVGFRKFGEPLMIYNYNQTFSFFNIGYGSAISYTITIFCGILGLIYINLLKKKGSKNE